jgi:uncharacterized UBP type Zn finger protein
MDIEVGSIIKLKNLSKIMRLNRKKNSLRISIFQQPCESHQKKHITNPGGGAKRHSGDEHKARQQPLQRNKKETRDRNTARIGDLKHDELKGT